VSEQLAKRYQRARKREKKEILDSFIELTGYHRVYAAWLLRNWGRKVELRGEDGRRIILVGDRDKKRKRKKPRKYGDEVRRVLKRIWMILDFPCGKRLAPYLKEIVRVLEREGELHLGEEVRSKLLCLSASTIDRLLAKERKKWQLKGRSTTKPGSLLKSKIPIRTFADWNEKKPGFLEIDLVGHEGGNPGGDYMQTLDATDIHTTWTETRGVKNKAQVWVFEALEEIIESMPFPILGIDSDNGGEFINAHLMRFCEENKITFTRSREHRKNDNCYVEQKNYSVVRKAVGYYRYDTEEELTVVNQLYQELRLYTNFFLPTMKLTEKVRIGSKVKKKYDTAKTPYQRVLQCPSIAEEAKKKLTAQYESLNPAQLKRTIIRFQNKLINLVIQKNQKEVEIEKVLSFV